MAMETLYCQCFYNLYNNKNYSGYILLCGSHLISSEVKVFGSNTEYEAVIKILHRMLFKITQPQIDRLKNSQLILEIKNKQVKEDLLSKQIKENLDASIKGLYIFIYSAINKYKIKLVDDFIEYSFNDNSISEYLFMYQIINKIFLLIRRSKGIVEDAYIQLSCKDSAIQDILHFIELSEINDKKKIEFIDVLKKLRLERRCIKDELEISKILNGSFSKIESNMKKVVLTNDQTDYNVLLQIYKPIFATKVSREKLLSSLNK